MNLTFKNIVSLFSKTKPDDLSAAIAEMEKTHRKFFEDRFRELGASVHECCWAIVRPPTLKFYVPALRTVLDGRARETLRTMFRAAADGIIDGELALLEKSAIENPAPATKTGEPLRIAK